MAGPAPPRVSVLMPAYNSPAEIVEAVRSALAQTVTDIEVIVSDDASTEPIAPRLEGVRDERLRVIRSERNRGIAGARNLALRSARGTFVAQLDHDDFWRENHLEDLLPLFDDPSVAVAYTNAEIVGHPEGLDRWIAKRRPGDGLPAWVSDRSIHPVNDLAMLYRANPICACAAALRTDSVRAVGGYPRGMDIATDYALYIRLRHAGWRFAYVDRRSAVYRWPQSSRGESFNRRRVARHELRLFVALALRSPRDQTIRRRLREIVKNLIATHVPGSLALWERLRPARRLHD